MEVVSYQQDSLLSCYKLFDKTIKKINLDDENPITKQKGKFMMRCYNEHCVKLLDRILMTSYVLKGYNDFLVNLSIPETSHILCVKYYLKKRSPNKTGDTQLFVTGGKTSRDKYIIDTVKREVYEETTLEIIDTTRIQFLGLKKTCKKNVHWYSCSIENMRIEGNTNKYKYKKSKSFKDKIACIIWGSKDEMRNKLKQIKINHKLNKEGIDGLVSIPFVDVKKILETINEKQYNWSDKFCWDTEQNYNFVTSHTSVKNDVIYDYIRDIYKGNEV